MINNISESTLRVASKIDPSGVIHDKEVNQQKAKEIAQARAVEKSDTGGQTESKTARKEDEGSSQYLLNGKQVVFEKYDKNGDLVLRLPPSETPVDQTV
jgi:hypothetical protein